MLNQSRTSANTLPAGHIAYVHTRVLSEQPNRSPRPRYTRSERAGFKRDTKQTLRGLAAAIGDYDLLDKLCRCHANVAAITCGTHIAQIIPDYSCGFRLCPDCGRRRAGKFMRKYLSAVLAFPAVSNTQACLLTLTQQHRPETFQASVKRLTASFKALRRSALFKAYFKGGIFSIEFTVDRQGRYHTHIHLLVFRTRRVKDEDLQRLKDQWFVITGDSHVINLKWINPNQAGGLAAGLREVLKYAVKPASIRDFTADHLRDFIAMKRQRMFGTFGDFQKFARTHEPEPEDLLPFTAGLSERGIGQPCSSCGKALYEVRLKGSELPAFLARCDHPPLRE